MNKIPLLLLPGTLNNARVWAAQVDALAPIADVRVADISTQDSITAMADDAIRTMPARFAVAGFSLGGFVALEIMRRAGARVAGLGLISTSARCEPEAGKPGREKSIALAQRDFPQVLAAMRPFVLGPGSANDAALNTLLDAMMHEVGAAAFVRQTRAVINRAESRDLLPTITCPTLVVCGRLDAVCPPKLSEEMAAAIRGADLHLLDGVGHMLPFESSAALTTLMQQWLARVVA